MTNWLKNYPWTKVVDNSVEPWRPLETSSWFDDIEEDIPGWTNISHAMCAAVQKIIDDHPNSFVNILQFKEKFGDARLYYDASDDISEPIKEIVNAFELASTQTCIKCGAAGKIREKLSWIAPLCDTCYAKIMDNRHS